MSEWGIERQRRRHQSCYWGHHRRDQFNGRLCVIRAHLDGGSNCWVSTSTWNRLIIRNAMGGYLSHPYEQLPSLFGNVTLFKTYPYLLPCLVAAGMTLLGIVFCHIYYTESLPSPSSYKRNSKSLSLNDMSHRRSSSVISDTDTLVDQSTESLLAKSHNSPDLPMMPGDKEEWGFWDLMAYKPVQILSTTMFMNSYVSIRGNGLMLVLSAEHGQLVPSCSFSTNVTAYQCRPRLSGPHRH
jgi:hypothetical protein